MGNEGNNANDTRFPTPMGSLERTIEEDDVLAGFTGSAEADVKELPDDTGDWEIDRMIIRLGGNGF